MVRVDLSNYQFVRVSGPDSIQFLQGQLSCDMELLSRSQSLCGALCNLQGRVIADLRVVQHGQDCLLQTGSAELLLSTLAKYAIFSKVELTIEEPAHAPIGLIGSGGDEMSTLLTDIFGDYPSSAGQLTQSPGNTSLVKIAGRSDRIEVWLHAVDGHDESQQAAIRTRLQAIPAAELEVWKRQDIEAGIVHVGPALSGEHTPQLLNYDISGVINFNKGCYTGQEIVARMHYRSTPKQRLFLADSKDPISAQSSVIQSSEASANQQAIIAFSNAAPATANTNLLLAILSTRAVTAAARFSLTDHPESSLKILSLPYTQ